MDNRRAARVIAKAERRYRGVITDPDRWTGFQPRDGDIMVVTPSKCGTTWTQTIIAMLLNGGPDLPAPLSVMSPWIDATLVTEDDMHAALAAQRGRRVVKTHTPADGFPVWDGVTVVTVFRHPLDVFLSIRKHIANMKDRGPHPMKASVPEALAYFLATPFETDRVDDDCVASVTEHYWRTALSERLPEKVVLHYADMTRDRAAAVARIAEALKIETDPRTQARIVEATGFGAMKENASAYAPEGGKGFWTSDTAFFAGGIAGGWREVLSAEDIAAYEARMAELVPDPARRRWIETGSAG